MILFWFNYSTCNLIHNNNDNKKNNIRKNSEENEKIHYF